ncbi:hypothetical protein BB561_001309 [Smittium simulii]|uniref:Enoyl-CoA hydratase n=1 Tax=Smittium simulii TaxID=133385 RepID=A0A2T9YV27_9FUNG|nr:hypothetical protein BB561_001309 [Smittium simulii]
MQNILSKTFSTLALESPTAGVLMVRLNRPNRLNAISTQMWSDLKNCFNAIKTDGNVRSVVISSNGKLFCSGIDLKDSTLSAPQSDKDIARKGYYHRLSILELQESISAIEQCDKPVICAINNGCIGAGVDLATACDIRYCTQDAYFIVKEVDIGMAADVGTLQRLPKVVANDSWVREICYTAKKVYAEEAKTFGLVSSVFDTKESLEVNALNTATLIASKSPVAIVSTKHLLNYSRDHTVAEGLAYNALWNTLMHNTADMPEAITSFFAKKSPSFAKL